MTDFWIKSGDLRPNLEAQLEDEDNNAIDLSNASSVDFHMEDVSGSVKVDSSATITDTNNGKVEYEWSSGDTDTAGTFFGEFQVDWDDGDPESFPNHDNIEIQITDEIA